MKVEVSNGELLDKLTILELKLSNISDVKKLTNIQKEHDELNPLAGQLFDSYGEELKNLYKQLAEINSELWTIEDDIRECERNKDFGSDFVSLARAVYFTNDKRSEIKKSINLLTGSGFVEEKSYEDYE
jgi:predicted nuclease with TOPRIM domain|tara:strand:+ start:98 stop:484 length:387 start_codon:yes stop_codon:yes gene_type:complete